MQTHTRPDSTNSAPNGSDDLEKDKGEHRENKSKHDVMPSWTTVKEYSKEYCNATAIHGVRYLAEENRNPIERLFWIVALTMCLTGCYLMVVKVKEKLDTTPVLVTFSETATNIWHVPFPAVTVCPETKSRQTFLNFTKYSNVFENLKARNITIVDDDNMTISEIPDEIRKKLDALRLVCLFERDDERQKAGLGKLFTDEDELKFLYKSTIQLDYPDTSDCYWGGRKLDGGCVRHLKPVWSEEGVCFTFNMMPDSVIYKQHIVNNNVFGYEGPEVENDWDPDKGYTLTAGLQSRPWRASGIDWDDPGLWLAFSENVNDIDYICRDGATGYKILLHSPVEMPLFRRNLAVDVPFERDVVVSLSPAYMTTSPGLEKYDPHKRQCYFSHEKDLQHFNFYTQKNCEIECVANATLKLCGCVPFYMPRDSSTKVCGGTSENCTIQASKQLKKHEILRDLAQRAAGEASDSFASECDCLPSCVSLEYKADVTQTQLSWEKTRRAKGVKQDHKLFDSAVYILFKDSQFISSRRSELYGQIDFLANCGGILGLFSGFSIVSLIELVYFLTIRIWSNVYGRWKRNRRARFQCNDIPESQNSTGKTSWDR